MKRFHVHLGVPDLPASIRFYTGLFGVEPTVNKDDYAKWMLDDPRVNFAISQRGQKTGLNHLGLQAETPDELAAVRQRFEAANRSTTIAQPNSHCCYAVSDKHWVTDPQGIAWEAFHSLDTIPLYSGSTAAEDSASGCCAPVTAQREGLSERRAGAPLAGMRAIANHGQRPKGDITALHSGSVEAERGPACRAASERETLVDPDTRRSSHATQKEGSSDPLLGVIENAAPNKVASGGACCR